MTTVSIIIPTYRRIDQTLRCIDLIKQSDGVGSDFEMEIIVADSTEDYSLRDAVEKRFGREIIYTRPEKPGIATNKNQGAKIAKHPVLIFCDSDMEVEKNTIVESLKVFKVYEGAAMMGVKVVWRGGEKDGQVDRPREEDRMIEIDGTTYCEAIYSRFMMTHKDIFWTVGGYDSEVFNMRGEGSDLSIRYWRAGYPLCFDKSIVVHHVHEASDSAALRVAHPEWGIAKDLFLLAYKYDMVGGEYPNFQKTVEANFKGLGQTGYWRLLQGILKHYDLIACSKPILDRQKKQMKAKYDFKFLEIFSQPDLLKECIKNSKA